MSGSSRRYSVTTTSAGSRGGTGGRARALELSRQVGAAEDELSKLADATDAPSVADQLLAEALKRRKRLGQALRRRSEELAIERRRTRALRAELRRVRRELTST